jgi:hypothetical protein
MILPALIPPLWFKLVNKRVPENPSLKKTDSALI